MAADSASITTLSMSSVFTPPSSCSSIWWTYENSDYNSVSNGLLIQNAVVEIQTECWPSDWGNFGRAQATQVYSPGWCPAGYTTAANQNGAVTTATCCLSGYSIFTTLTTGGGPETVIFAGCLSTFAKGSTTTVLNRGDDNILDTTVVSGPITAWAVPITIQVAASQTPLFTTSTTATPAAGVGTTSTTPTPTQEPTQQPTGTASSSPGLSSGAQAGIGVGVALGALVVLGTLGFFFWRRRRRQRIGGARPDMPPELDDKQAPPGELDGTARPPGELPGDNPNLGMAGAQPSRGKSVRRQNGPPAELEG